MEKKVYNFGILSTASIALKLANAIEDCPEANLAAIASRSLEKAQKWIQDNNQKNVKAYGTYDELLQDKSIEIVYIPVPTAHKFEWAMKAVRNGKHIILDKPLPGSINTKELRELLDLCKLKHIHFMDCTMFIHSLRTNEIVEKIKQGEIGKVTKVIAGFSYFASENFNKSDIRIQQDLEPLGALGDVCWYSCMAALVAFDFETPLKIQALNWKFAENGSLVDILGILRFSDNKVAIVDGSFIESKRQNLEIVGEKGTFRIASFSTGDEELGVKGASRSRFLSSGQYIQTKDGVISNFSTEKSDQAKLLVENYINKIEKQDFSYRMADLSLLNQQILVHLFLSVKKNGETLDFDQNL
ncbi:hypothetical protein PPERSA_05004 [Pseudocohnilembus persalinus]|uniref:Uncharacterized protein n=1 Tax=Pseudocohnilembus persalinus TaxID=266149 RepID=A0A0V0QVX2_PSEPJ|nr:hypothetical protein PPERSA_05004 [Pseudocohnilembus persalinus]|eukprot:KRX06391.1 hypothetical protein PPERSA_05004 [Pseudocohnilembus persalinus]